MIGLMLLYVSVIVWKDWFNVCVMGVILNFDLVKVVLLSLICFRYV